MTTNQLTLAERFENVAVVLGIDPQELTLDHIKQVLNYDPETGGFTYGPLGKSHRHGFIEEMAGQIIPENTNGGFSRINFCGYTFRSARMAYLLMMGEWPAKELRFIDNNRLNLRWDNIREDTGSNLWTPNWMDHWAVREFVEWYIAKEFAGQSGARGDTGPRRRVQAGMGKYAELAWNEITGGRCDFKQWSDGSLKDVPDIYPTKEDPLKPAWRGKRLHVKTCNMAFAGKRFDSWTAGKNETIVNSPKDNDYILLSYTAESGDTIRLGYVKATDLKGYWKPTVKIPHKVAVYFEDIQHLVVQDFPN